MTQRQFDSRAPAAAEPHSAYRLHVSEQETAQVPGQHLLVRSPVAAATLRQASGGRLALAGASLLDLQRRYGNRYVQQVVNS
jgi:hypothetical protein